MRNPLKLEKSLEIRKGQNALRSLQPKNNLVDFSSNDYLGFAALPEISENTFSLLQEFKLNKNGSTGSRLLCGNHELFTETEAFLAQFHNSLAALIFNSGYDANVGFFSSVPQRGDIIFYDELVHASIRDGILMSHAKALKFPHNNLEVLAKKIKNIREQRIAFKGEIYIVTESVFSMDGDQPPLGELSLLAEEQDCFLLVDEAHAVGIFGNSGRGLVCELGLEDKIFARIITFGKGIGSHGAAILGSHELKEYLLNFARSFIYTTALPPHSVAGILSAYRYLENSPEAENASRNLKNNISFFLEEVKHLKLDPLFIPSISAIQCCIIPGNNEVRAVANKLQENGYDVRAILSPTVPKGSERIRICLHSFNTSEEINGLVKLMATFIK
ncbi:pyridoxal phosphate-dependent aminotransferase family protein [Antarcticibacterium arcticum]|uniref:Pyridoxal phosphate-dependent aminotransferase family protein n=1 Tax=Antarcticibacterium arcticum TaxID=2585771 RepID=A0A5B8YL01_9FLAO|nr:pyridoxal phosphate-dependent aminotransferase family protein [Antarcticibacterium arcticum]QED38291.1 pyridoxal phosphate-dependent aminotransferase family protein [Antarcticibacterium arcticum]